MKFDAKAHLNIQCGEHDAATMDSQIITCLLTLSSFWIDTPSMAIALVIFNVLLQGLFGWDLIRELPPGSGSIPKIVSLYGFNLSMTTIAFIVHVLSQFFESVLPDDLELPEKVSSYEQVLTPYLDTGVHLVHVTAAGSRAIAERERRKSCHRLSGCLKVLEPHALSARGVPQIPFHQRCT
ncbi:hypothetical protein COOONC_06523 [Cooperia oncophora]